MNRPYPSYRYSGVEWLGEIPEHWELQQFGRMGSFFKGGGGTKEDEVEDGIPCVRYGDLYTQHQFLIRRTRAGIVQDSVERYRQLQYGDVLFAGSGETIGEIGKSAVNLIEGRAYCGGDVIGLRPSVEVDAVFLGYAADCHAAIYQKACMGRGVTVMHIYSRELKYMLIPLPPLDEQRAIAEFINRETDKIDELVVKQRLLLERLAEYRTALITRTVTQGLPPEAAQAAGLDLSSPLQPSGVDWPREIPRTWEVKQLRRIARLEAGDSITADDIDDVGDFPVFGGNGVRGFADRYTHDGEYVLIGRQGALCGNVHLARGRFFASEHAVVVTPVSIESVAWLKHLLEAMELNQYSVAAAQPGLAVDRINAIRLPVPPRNEQSAIAEFLDRSMDRIDALVARVEMAIERLQEYRMTLVTAAVTGKIDVRDAAASIAGGVGA